MSNTMFALDLGEHYIKLADVERKSNGLIAKSVAYNNLPFNPYVTSADDYTKKGAEFIKKMLTEAKIKKREVAIVIPDSQSYTRIFEMPMLTEKELLSAIRYQADQFIPIPIDKVSLDIHILHKDKQSNKTMILLVAASKSIMEHVVQLVNAASLTPVSIENETSASLRLISFFQEIAPSKTSSVHVYINFGESSSSLYLYDVNKKLPLQVHNFAIGRNIFQRDIQANLTLNDQQITDLIEKVGFTDVQSPYDLSQILNSPLNEFVTEVSRFIASSKEQGGSVVQELYIFGEGSKVAGLHKKLQSLIGLPVKALDLSPYFEKNTVSEYFSQDWPLMVPAVGSSLR